MKKQKSLKINFIMNALLNMSSFIFPLIAFPYISRILLPQGVGKAAFAVSVATFFSLFAQLGIPVYGIKACAGVRDDKETLSRTVQEIVILNAVTCFLSCLFYGICLSLVPGMQKDKILFLLVGLLIPLNMIGVEWLYQALEQYSYITLRSMLFKAIAIIGMLVFIHKQEDYILYGFLTVFASSASNICNFIKLRQIISFRMFPKYNLRKHLRPILFFFAMSCAVTVYTSLGEMMLGLLSSSEQAGFYHTAARIKSVMVSLITALGDVLLPRAVYYVEQGLKEHFLTIVKQAMHFVYIASPPLIIYILLFAPECISLLLGKSYTGTILPLRILMPALILIGISGVIGNQILIPLGKERYVLYSELGGASADVLLNILLIPSIGAAGAAIGAFSAEAVVLLIQLFYLNRLGIITLRSLRPPAAMLQALLAGTASCIWVKYIPLNEFFVILLSFILFFSVYAAGLFLKRDSLIYEYSKTICKNLRGRVQWKKD